MAVLVGFVMEGIWGSQGVQHSRTWLSTCSHSCNGGDMGVREYSTYLATSSM